MKVRVVLSGALLLWGCSADGCGSQVDEKAAPPLPHVAITPDPEFVVAHYGKPFTITATLTDDAGAPATGYEWTWMHADAIEATRWTLNASSPSPGVEQVTFSPPIYAVSQVYGRMHTCGRKNDSECFYENN